MSSSTLFLTSALEGVRGQRHAHTVFTPGKDQVPIAQEAGWASGPVWTGAENLAPTGIRSPDRPARRQSLYRLHYPAHIYYLIRNFLRFAHFKGSNGTIIIVRKVIKFHSQESN